MSDNDNQASKQTSSVPLKKETVRVTLKAADAPSASPTGAPPAPAAPRPTVAAPRPPTPSAPRPPAPTAGPRPSAPAPTIPLKTAGAPAPTIKLSAPASSGAPTIALKPAGAPAPGGATVALPKATVQLQPPTQPLGSAGPSASQAATMQGADEEEEDGPNPIVNALAILGFLGAAAVIAFQLMTSAVWIGAEDNDDQGDWSQLF